ncbi:polyprotein [Gossypium australe]|uniref:Polyprotein n=1 Tax=Gossypium australe TaxID=47621 RepID=A0A5B6VZ53_9ROSI|nr:polyprotein [Gossypium australe]
MMISMQAQQTQQQSVVAKDTVPVPQVPVKIYLDKYSKLVTVTAFLDTGAATIMNPDVLPSEWWMPRTPFFNSIANYPFATYLKSKPIVIQFFPRCFVKTIVLGSKLLGKDIAIGFDIYSKAQYSHTEFFSKCSNPLWKNFDFFISSPFKKNKDINPTKASHQGMNPKHLRLAKKECEDLQRQSLIEPSYSQWACEAFYVNKRFEKIRGKLRLVVNYEPLNLFLQDDKFLLPNKKTLFSSLAKAKVYSKFDFKARFWQLGVIPEDRLKTGFCIPNKHYQWKVMPFRLTTTPSKFQKAMTRIFHPIMNSTLIYIDDIFLYSPDEEAHSKLLNQFSQLIFQYGIMISERKMHINKSEIEYLGMNLKEGKYSPEPHIAKKLLEFPDADLTKKQV